jgi:hypothetical protein
MGEDSFKILVEKLEGRRPPVLPGRRWEVIPIPVVLESDDHDPHILLTSFIVIMFMGLSERQSLYTFSTKHYRGQNIKGHSHSKYS